MNILSKNSLTEYKFGFKTSASYLYKSPKGLTKNLIKEISAFKKEPKWMLDFRLKAYEIFLHTPLPTWGGDLSKLDFKNIHYYVNPQDKPKNKWEEVPKEIKDTFARIGIPQSERKFFAGTGAQFESEMVYHSLKKELTKKGIIFESTDIGLQKYPELFKQYFGKIVPANDNKFAALNSAVWSGGSFIYIPKNVHLDLPLQAYFRINAENMGQFERTLIIADEGSSLHYLEGCTAPVYSTDSLHAAVVEIIIKKNAHVQYTTIQNWSNNVYNLVTKRAFAYEDAHMFWLDVNIGSALTMKYPATFLLGRGAKCEVQSLAMADHLQHQDAGAKAIHAAPETSSKIVSKSISKNGGIASFRGLVKINRGAKDSKSHMVCDGLILDKSSKTDAYPALQIDESEMSVSHEASISKINGNQLFYLMSRGLTEEQAISLIINGFAEPIVKQLPTEYALELNRFLEMKTGGHQTRSEA